MAIGKNLGANSQSSNDFLEPLAPINLVVADVGTGRAFDDAAITVDFDLPANSPEATTYYAEFAGTYTASGSTLPLTITGIPSNTTGTVVAYASNAAGTGNTTESGSVTATTVPDVPTGVTGTSPAGATYDTVSWTAPDNGGSAITLYTVLSNENETQTSTTTSLNFPQSGGENNTYQVKATNANGDSAYSTASGTVTTFTFTPFGFTPFGFVPFSFTPFGFTPFGFTPFGFTPFGFSPFSFTPFNFAPFSFTPNFRFTPFNFTPGFGR